MCDSYIFLTLMYFQMICEALSVSCQALPCHWSHSEWRHGMRHVAQLLESVSSQRSHAKPTENFFSLDADYTCFKRIGYYRMCQSHITRPQPPSNPIRSQFVIVVHYSLSTSQVLWKGSCWQNYTVCDMKDFLGLNNFLNINSYS